jgi:hypothetical protein
MADRRWATPGLGVAGAVSLAALALLDDAGTSSAITLFAAALLAVTSLGALGGNRFLAQRMLGIGAVGAGLAIGYLILQSPLLPRADGQPAIRGLDGPAFLIATVAGIVLCASAALLAKRARTQRAWLWEGRIT